ncbi:hypothetical protein SLITO_v1c06200 [Spiroplasma litorale]|uniref:Uncharacterized protein n=1 Tax=Spiroplasma litorale TaxID=216942 RepID=A0A0K1W2C7_9MOLU|nr:hypothetical protein [Spiroplasma litorale]AKX34252.1 hypothetical protein SLITO_v1c06200 [Spiroplasma litorale]
MYYSDSNDLNIVKTFKDYIKKSNLIYIVSPFISKEAFLVFKNEFDFFVNKGGIINVITSTFNETWESFNYDDLKYISDMYKDSINIKVQNVKRGEKPLHKKMFFLVMIKILRYSQEVQILVIVGYLVKKIVYFCMMNKNIMLIKILSICEIIMEVIT